MRAVDLFAGCGGLSLGLKKAGMEVVAAFDNWEPALEVYRANNPDHEAFQSDLGNLNGDFEQISKFKPDMIAGGPPCQDFSSAGKRDETLGRADLTPAFASIVCSIKPTWFIMENVPEAPKSTRYQAARKMMEDAGYGTTLMVLDASLCGVPQKRKRAFLIGRTGEEHDFLRQLIESRLSEKPTTIRDYLGDRLGLEHYYRHPRNYNRRGIYSIDEPSPTVRGVNRPVPQGYPGHPADSAAKSASLRPLTTEERSWIQTFPFDYKWIGKKTALEQMIGNAVPVLLARFVGQAIMDYEAKVGKAA